MRFFLIPITFIGFLLGCQYIQPKQDSDDVVIARVGGQTLIRSNLEEMIPENISPEDSILFTEKFLSDWIRKQLTIQKAYDEITLEETAIEKKVSNYQDELLIHELKRRYIEKNINLTVSDEEVENYYKQRSEKFLLRQNLVSCIYIKTLKNKPQIRKLRKFVKNYPSESLDLSNYANTYAIKSFLEDSIWLSIDDILLEIPKINFYSETFFFEKNKFIEVTDEKYIYFLKILDFRKIGDDAPKSFIKNRIEDIIINKRKIELKKELDKTIYEEGIQKKLFQIYTP